MHRASKKPSERRVPLGSVLNARSVPFVISLTCNGLVSAHPDGCTQIVAEVLVITYLLIHRTIAPSPNRVTHADCGVTLRKKLKRFMLLPIHSSRRWPLRCDMTAHSRVIP